MKYCFVFMLVVGGIFLMGKQVSAHGWHEEVIETVEHFGVHVLQFGVGIVGTAAALYLWSALSDSKERKNLSSEKQK